MNTLVGKITQINTLEGISLVTIDVSGIHFKSIILETPDTADYLHYGQQINLHFKETEVIIGKNNADQISLQNIIKGRITEIKRGKILSKIEIISKIGIISSIITTDSVERLNLTIDEKVQAMIKTNEIMLSK